MSSTNLQRLIRLAEETFAVKDDPDQLNVDERVMKRLKKIHPSTINEHVEGDGPVAWVLVIPTTTDIMNRFLEKKITEKELFELTPTGVNYEALYMCSALVLEEYRQKGIARDLAIQAINQIRKTHPLKALFVWPFSREGDLASERVAQLVSLPLYKRDPH